MTCLKSPSRRESYPPRFTQLLCLQKIQWQGSFESKNANILSASLKDAGKQSTVVYYVNGCSVSERIVLFTPTMCCQLLNHLLSHQFDLLLLIPVGVGSIPALRSSGAKIWVGEEKAKTWKWDLGLVKWCHFTYSTIRKLFFIFFFFLISQLVFLNRVTRCSVTGITQSCIFAVWYHEKHKERG